MVETNLVSSKSEARRLVEQNGISINQIKENDDKDTWFNKMKLLCDNSGYCSNMKEYKEKPDNYKGSIVDISMVIRVALTTKSMTPDLYEIMKLLGVNRIKNRIDKLD